MRYARLALHLFWGALTVACAYPFLSDAPKRWLKQRWSRQLLEILGVRFQANFQGRWRSGLLVANHISWLDIFVLNAARPMAFVAKSEVRGWPLFGWLAAHTETIFLQRERRGHARIVNEQIAGLLASGLDIAIFPEGTTTDGTCLLPFHGALLQPAIDSACPIQPASLAYFDEHGRRCPAPAYAGQTTLAESVSAIIACRSLTVRLRTTPSIMPNASQTRRELACMAHGAIAYSLGLGTEFMDDAPMPGPLPWADRPGSRETPLEGSA